MKNIAIAWALALGLGTAAPVMAGEWILVGADDTAVASLWLVKQDSAKSPKVMLEDHIEFDQTDTVRAHGMSRFTLYDCAEGTVERGAASYYEPGRGDEIDAEDAEDDWDDAPRKPAEGSYDARLLALACAIDRNDPALASFPRLSQPFTRADVERVKAKTAP